MVRIGLLFPGISFCSYFRAVGKPIFAEPVEITEAAKALWEADFVVISHGTEEDPIFNYGTPSVPHVPSMTLGGTPRSARHCPWCNVKSTVSTSMPLPLCEWYSSDIVNTGLLFPCHWARRRQPEGSGSV